MVNVLLVDDSEDIGILISNGLSPYFVHRATSIGEAKAFLNENSYHLMLIDVPEPLS
jgi:DNA-binding response OmpR family regulator